MRFDTLVFVTSLGQFALESFQVKRVELNCP